MEGRPLPTALPPGVIIYTIQDYLMHYNFKVKISTAELEYHLVKYIFYTKSLNKFCKRIQKAL